MERTSPMKGERMAHEPEELVTLFTGTIAEVLPLDPALKNRGFHPFIADMNIKTIDPFVTGGNIFNVRLQIPAGEAEEAYAALQEIRSEPGSPTAEPVDGMEPVEETDADVTALEALGKRLRWGLVLLVMVGGVFFIFPAPGIIALLFYLFFGVRYLLRAQKSATVPVNHGLTVASLVVLVVIAISAVLLFLQIR